MVKAASLDRVPPQNLEAERAALGAMLLGNEPSREALAKVAATLQIPDFYRTGHQRLFAAIRALFERGEKVDLITVTDWLGKAGELELVGGHAYVAGLVDEIPLTANIEDYVRIIRDKAMMRRLMEVGSDLFGRASEDALTPDALLDASSQLLYEMAQHRYSGGMRRIADLTLSEAERVEDLAQRAAAGGAILTGLPTGFKALDDLTLGLQSGEMIVLAARPGMGKTSFALNMAEQVALSRTAPVLIFSLEMSARSLVRRLVCAHARVDSREVQRGRLFAEDRSRIMNAFGVLNDVPIWIDESSRLTPLELRARARRVLGEARAQAGQGLIIVDYMQLMDFHAEGSGMRPENRQQEITAISRSLKAVAKDLNIPIVVLSQLSRQPERRGDDMKPRLSDLRESGAIEQDADVVIFLYRDPKFVPEGEQEKEDQQAWTVRLSVAKQRNGPTGAFSVLFNRQYTRFDAVDWGQMEQADEA